MVIDECFIEFTKRQNESLIKTAIHSQYLIVVRAFTKIYGIPGVRLGYLAASEKMVECLKRQLPEWNVSLLAQPLKETRSKPVDKKANVFLLLNFLITIFSYADF